MQIIVYLSCFYSCRKELTLISVITQGHDVIHPMIKHCLLIVIASQYLIACTSLSNEAYIKEVKQMGLQKYTMQAGQFPLIYYTRPYNDKSNTLHIYIGGDGIPWHDKFFISEDPGPYNPMVLQLMMQDSKPSIYLGRPCYEGQAKMPPCEFEHWTAGRFSEEIISSMRIAIMQLLEQDQYEKLVLIGFSGGGTLATLLAHQITQTTMLVTIAGNLDTDAWTNFHHYSSMLNSINPADLPALDVAIRQIHLQGDRDRNIPAQLTVRYTEKQKNISIKSFPKADHSCCWLTYWPEIVKTLP